MAKTELLHKHQSMLDQISHDCGDVARMRVLELGADVRGADARKVNDAIKEAFEFFAKRSENGFIVPEWAPTPDNARYAGAVVETDDSRALVEFDELFEHDGDGAPKLREWVGGAALRPPPPRARGFEARLRPGAPVDLWHNGGWWEVEIIGRAGSGFDVQSPVFPELKRAGVEAATLRPRWALIDGQQWLAMPPLGFKADLASHVKTPWPGPHFMALELVPGAVRDYRGAVTYPKAFG